MATSNKKIYIINIYFKYYNNNNNLIQPIKINSFVVDMVDQVKK